MRFDERRVVVALDAEGGEPTVTEIDDAGVLAGADDDPRRFGGEAAVEFVRSAVR